MLQSRHYLQLHLLVLINSFFPIIAIWISIPSVEIVFFRTMIASVLLGAFIFYRRYHYKVDKPDLIKMLASGMLTAIYWMLLVVSAKISNASVCLVGISTSSLWVSFINPVFLKKSVNYYQLLTGLCAFFGVYIIFSSDFNYSTGLLVAIIAAFCGALLTIINSRLSQRKNHYIITFYQMAGAWLGTSFFLPLYANYFASGGPQLNPTITDWVLILALAFVFSIYLYSLLIKLMQVIPPFTITLVSNLSPVYGIVVALFIFGRSELMTKYFYAGAVIIFFSVISYPLMRYIASKIETSEHPLPVE